jgi:hypothetical protein
MTVAIHDVLHIKVTASACLGEKASIKSPQSIKMRASLSPHLMAMDFFIEEIMS